jgi:hypothetical protein
MRRFLLLVVGVAILSVASLLFAAPAPVARAEPALLTVGKSYSFTMAGQRNSSLNGVVLGLRADQWVKLRVSAGTLGDKTVWLNLAQVGVIEPEE